MGKFRIVVGSLIAAVAVVWLFLPTFLGVAINLTCQEPISKTCQTRMRSLGHLYAASGNLRRAVEWYEWAAQSGDRAAMFHAGWAHDAFVTEDLRRRVEKAIKSDGRFYSPERNSPDDLAAFAWYQRGAKAGFAPAMINLAEMYCHGVASGEPDLLSAFSWSLKAAELGNPIAQRNLAVEYEEGWGTNPNAMLAEYWAKVPRENKDPADLEEPTYSRTQILPPGVHLHLMPKLVPRK